MLLEQLNSTEKQPDIVIIADEENRLFKANDNVSGEQVQGKSKMDALLKLGNVLTDKQLYNSEDIDSIIKAHIAILNHDDQQ